MQTFRESHLKEKRKIALLTEKLDALEGKKRFDVNKAFSKENDVSFAGALKEGTLFCICVGGTNVKNSYARRLFKRRNRFKSIKLLIFNVEISK